MTKKVNIPTFFLWINLDFEKDRDFLPKLYLERLKEEKEQREEAGITAPLCLVYLSSFLVSDKSRQIQAIKDLGIQVLDYDELKQRKDYKQSEISAFLTRKIMEDIPNYAHLTSVSGNKADLIDIIKLELAYNYDSIIENANAGCIVQDFDVWLDYAKLEQNIPDATDDRLFFGQIPEENIALGPNEVENNFMYVSQSRNRNLEKLIETCVEAKKSSDFALLKKTGSLQFHEKHAHNEVQKELPVMNINFCCEKVFKVISYFKHVFCFPEDAFSAVESHKSWKDTTHLDYVYGIEEVQQPESSNTKASSL